jgi:V/A-type H+-transporting ATPase subunit I
MRKYAFMVYHREYDGFLSTLRELGVVHIKETKSITDHAGLQAMLSERKRVASVLHSFKVRNSENKKAALAPPRRINKKEGLKLLEKIEEAEEKRTQLQAQRQSLLKDMSYMDLWGDFNYTNIRNLKKAGYVVTFFTCPTAKFEPKWVDEYNAILINNFQSVTYFITLTKEGTVIDIDAERPKMPDRGLAKLQARYGQLAVDIDQLDGQLNEMAAGEYNTLEDFDKNLQDEFNLAHAIVQTDKQAGDKLMFLEGWTTDDKAVALEDTLDKQGYFFHEEEIEEDDRVPIKLKNNRYSRLFEPITKMYSLPNYTELDPTPLLAPFFMLFFGLCFGDGGYGLIILLLCTFLKKKVSPDVRPFLSLFQWLGGMTIVVGALTGSFFGIALVDIPAFHAVKDYFLTTDNLMTLSVVIGLIHILFGKAVAAYKTKIQKGVKHSIAPFAWVFVIASLVCVFGLPELNIHLPDAVAYTLYSIAAVGLVIVFLYNSPGKNIFLNFGLGIWNTYNVIFGLLGDTLSYIRLFAVGLTGSILGGVFNQLAGSMTEGLPWVPRFVLMLLILLLGHGLNFGLCMIGSLVHPVRLIFVEYFKNSEFEGGSKEFAPFKKA